MAHDLFISYSSKDKDQADQLAELLLSAGLSVWIDRAGIHAATNWSKEIVTAINDCTVFVLLLSAASLASHNVIKEVSLASEKRKKILPIDLEPVSLNEDFEYQLAGIQRAPISNIDAILRGLGRLGLTATSAPVLKVEQDADTRKSLMILPFEDLSPTGDNGWFADGIVSELISALTHIKALRIADAQTTKDFKRYQGTLPAYARDMHIRYFVQGDVRKFGDNIKITSRLLDIETGDHLWQDSMKGTMDDIFEIQEQVAEKVVGGLKVHLETEERAKLATHDTINTEAYELYLRAREFFHLSTKRGMELAAQTATEAIALDPNFARAYSLKANALAGIYKAYDRDPALLDQAETLCHKAMLLDPAYSAVYDPLSQIALHRRMYAEAERYASEFVRREPDNYYTHYALGCVYGVTAQYDKAIAAYEKAVHLKPTDIYSLWNLVSALDTSGDATRCAEWAAQALPHFERHLKMHPDDESRQVLRVALILLSGNQNDAYEAAMKLTNLRDGATLFNLACFFGKIDHKPEALRTFRRAIESGFRSTFVLNSFLNHETEGIYTLRDTPEYEDVKRLVDEITASETA
jgi:adenylate cyclase